MPSLLSQDRGRGLAKLAWSKQSLRAVRTLDQQLEDAREAFGILIGVVRLDELRRRQRCQHEGEETGERVRLIDNLRIDVGHCLEDVVIVSGLGGQMQSLPPVGLFRFRA